MNTEQPLYLETVRRISDGDVCAYYIRGGISPEQFLEQFQRYLLPGYTYRVEDVWCEYWRTVPSRSKKCASRIVKCEADHPEAVAVTGISLKSWKR